MRTISAEYLARSPDLGDGMRLNRRIITGIAFWRTRNEVGKTLDDNRCRLLVRYENSRESSSGGGKGDNYRTRQRLKAK